ncbi:putative signal recognition particle 43 kDa protein, chloroplastic [Ananas comosus]|uniref:Putative signal recognition particle 43 kDa protein, chloroplastic n=1 Tax=Ananas comosus TaxID=4615 RepID=A0A199UNS5_ANACO|nr:putative signal recognition particle 43 kDa protein, chloroplastic [Ananas comosus]
MEAVVVNPSLSRLKLPPLKSQTLTFPRPIPTTLNPHLPRRRHYRLLFAFRDQSPHPPVAADEEEEEEEEEVGEYYGEVNRIIGSRSVRAPVFSDDGSATAEASTEYLVEWKDGHAPSWVPASGVAADVVAEYETRGGPPPRRATPRRSPPSSPTLRRRDPTPGPDGRTPSTSPPGSAPTTASVRSPRPAPTSTAPTAPAGACARSTWPPALALNPCFGQIRAPRGGAGAAGGRGGCGGGGREGADGAGTGEGGAGGDAEGDRRRSRGGWGGGGGGGAGGGGVRVGEVARVVEARGEGKRREYLVEWRDGGERDWVRAEWVADDVAADFEAGLEYGVAEAVVGRRDAAEAGSTWSSGWTSRTPPGSRRRTSTRSSCRSSSASRPRRRRRRIDLAVRRRRRRWAENF